VTWQVRNNLTHDAEKLTIDGSVRFLLKYWAELCDIQQKASTFDAKGKRPMPDPLVVGKQGSKCKESSKWQKPEAGWIKINVDGAFDGCFVEGGIGIVIRDDMMAIKLTAWKYIDKAGDAEEVKALACAEGLKLALDWCSARAVLASDCATLVAVLQDQGELCSRLKLIIDEVKLAGDDLPEWTVVHTKR